ncbi:MAG: hypothetical protein MZU97_16435 [Bacillus subtilis]|nr:hypothetical protein [Bacillus subtilis]
MYLGTEIYYRLEAVRDLKAKQSRSAWNDEPRAPRVPRDRRARRRRRSDSQHENAPAMFPSSPTSNGTAISMVSKICRSCKKWAR